MNSYKKILEYRSLLMGAAILWVVFFHMPIEIANKAVKFIWEIGYGGVDIFFFLSGIGVYYSLKKNTIEVFYCRRLKRIMPSYLPIVLATFVLYNYQNWQGISFAAVVDWAKQLTGNIFMTGWFSQANGQFNWYVQAVIWFYLSAPLFLYLIRRVAGNKRKMICFWIMVLLMQIPFFDTAIHKMPSRLLIFVLGIWAAWIYEEGGRKKENRVLQYAAMVIGMAVLLGAYCFVPDWLSMYGLYWYPFVLIVPGVCALLADLFHVMGKYRGTAVITNGLRCLGEASFEIYLIHILLFESILKPIGFHGTKNWMLAAIFAVLAGVLYKKLIIGVEKRFHFA